MQRTESDLLELARIMGGSYTSILRYIVIPSALPAFGGGLRVAAAVAPIGAIVGEWVGASKGLGFYMLHANARMQVDSMFAALFLLAVVSVGLYYLIDLLLLKIIYWEKPRELYHE
jgi:putative hydroxymethylpyrimidine transport system permease protein